MEEKVWKTKIALVKEQNAKGMEIVTLAENITDLANTSLFRPVNALKQKKNEKKPERNVTTGEKKYQELHLQSLGE